MKIILASASIGRKKVLESLGLKFAIVPADIDEDKFTAKNPITLVKKIAKAKALAVLAKLEDGASQFSTTPSIPPCLIIAADSMVFFKGQTYGKPRSRTEAKQLLTRLSGQTHEFITGLYIINTKNNKIYQKSCKSRVIFGKFTPKELDEYIKIANVTSYAGGFAPDLPGGEIIRAKMKIIGSKSNVLGGLPLENLLPVLKENGVIVH